MILVFIIHFQVTPLQQRGVQPQFCCVVKKKLNPILPLARAMYCWLFLIHYCNVASLSKIKMSGPIEPGSNVWTSACIFLITKILGFWSAEIEFDTDAGQTITWRAWMNIYTYTWRPWLILMLLHTYTHLVYIYKLAILCTYQRRPWRFINKSPLSHGKQCQS